MSTITISALGSRGDVQPVVALGVALVARGHTVRVATHARFAPLVVGAGLLHAEMGEGFDSEGLWASPSGIRLAETRDPLLYGLRLFRRVRPHLERHFAECRDACRGSDLLLGLQTVEMASAPVARALGLPYVPLFLSPPDPRFFHPPLLRDVAPRIADVAARILGHRRAFARAAQRVLGKDGNAPLRTLRYIGEAEGAEQEEGGHGLALVGTSDVVVARPFDWEPRIVTTGYWFDAARSTPLDPRIEAFLAAGAPPVCMGFGSMPDRDPRGLAHTMIEAARRAGARLLMLGGWGSGREAEAACASAESHDVLWARDAPHGSLFPRASSIVHHGGAGTTAAALLAGVPSMAVPHFGDQHFWGKRIAALGAGPPPIPRAKLDAAELARGLRAMQSNDTLQARARAIGKALEIERGADRAAEVLDRAWIGSNRLAGWRATR